MHSIQPSRKTPIYNKRNCSFCNACFQPESSRHKHCSWQCRFNELCSGFNGDDCWEWPLSRNKKTGYGQFMISANPMILETSHRVSYALFNGSISDGEYICHTCDNRACFNPKHLFSGTPADNVFDMFQKGRQAKNKNMPELESNYNSKLDINKVLFIRQSNLSTRKLAKLFCVSQTAIRCAKNKSTWKSA